MENLGRQAGFLKGLLEGANLEAASPEGKLLSGIVELLGALSERVEAMDDLMADLNDYVQSIDDDLTELENDYDGFDGEELDDDGALSFDDDEEEGAFPPDNLHVLKPNAAVDEDAAERPLLGRLCPECKGLFFTDAEDDEDAVYRCPHCGKPVTPAPLAPGNVPVVRPIEE